MNLANSLNIETPKLVHFEHLLIETESVGNLLDGIAATRIENSTGIWRRTTRDNRMVHMHDIETISKNIYLTASKLEIRNYKLGKFLSGKCRKKILKCFDSTK